MAQILDLVRNASWGFQSSTLLMQIAVADATGKSQSTTKTCWCVERALMMECSTLVVYRLCKKEGAKRKETDGKRVVSRKGIGGMHSSIPALANGPQTAMDYDKRRPPQRPCPALIRAGLSSWISNIEIPLALGSQREGGTGPPPRPSSLIGGPSEASTGGRKEPRQYLSKWHTAVHRLGLIGTE